MFGIGGSEFVFILIVVLLLFGSDKIPEFAKTVAKIINQVKHASDDLKSEIKKSAEDSGINLDNLTGGVSTEIQKAKEEMTNIVSTKDLELGNPLDEIQKPIEKVKEDIELLSGPIKRQR